MVERTGGDADAGSGKGGSDNDILVVGQLGRDLILNVEQIPEAGGSTTVTTRHELLGGRPDLAELRPA